MIYIVYYGKDTNDLHLFIYLFIYSTFGVNVFMSDVHGALAE